MLPLFLFGGLEFEVESLYLRDLPPLIASLSVLDTALIILNLKDGDDSVLSLGSPLLVWFHIIL